MQELQNEDDSSDFIDTEDDAKYLSQMEEFMRGANNPVLILNSDKYVHSLNAECEDLLGFREGSSKGSSIDEVARDQDIAATILSLCEQSSVADGSSQNESYELRGDEYNIYVNSLVGKDNFTKAFYISFVKEE